ncbi:MAG: hypothetical protein KC503_21410, partial [Myxococcales bacterium]|nr:hypothetical protein [Myxococcales bacterium]
RGATPPGTVRNVLRLSVPAGMQNLFMSAGFVALYRIAQLLGTRELAAANVLINLSLTCLLPAMGFGLAAATLVGQALGRRAPDEAKRWGWTTMFISCATLVVLGVVLAAPARTWLGLLMKDVHAVELATAPLILLGIAQPFDSVGLVLMQALIGAGYVRVVTFWSIALQWALFLPAAYIIGVRYGAGLMGVWICLAIYRGLFSGVMALTFARDNWVKTRI